MSESVPSELSDSQMPDWLAEWVRERKKSPEEIHRFFVATFAERVAYWRNMGEHTRPYVLPFYYEDQNKNGLSMTGGLWIPDAGAQELVEMAGHHLIHYVLDDDLENAASDMGLFLNPPFHRKRLDLREEEPRIDPYNLYLFTGLLRDQVETDYGVRLVDYLD